MPGYYFQNFDEQLSGVMPTKWLKTPTTPYVLTSNVWSFSPLNSISTRMADGKQCALNLSTVGIDIWNGEHFYFKIKTPSFPPNKPEAPYFAISTIDFSGTYIPSTYFKCVLMLRRSAHAIYYGSGGILFDSGLVWTANTQYDCKIVLDETGNNFSIYMNSIPIVERFPAFPGQVESFIIEGDNLATTVFYLDDFQIGEAPPIPTDTILKDVTLKDSMVIV